MPVQSPLTVVRIRLVFLRRSQQRRVLAPRGMRVEHDCGGTKLLPWNAAKGRRVRLCGQRGK